MPATPRSPRSTRMLGGGVILAVGLLAGPAQSASAAAAPATGCADIEVVVARGTGEQGTVGVLGAVASAIRSGTARTVATYGVPYPASADWMNSSSAGVSALAQHLAAQSSSCPAQRFVLLGYSQGAWVVGDALAGSGFGGAAAVPGAAGSRVAAVVLYGDPRFVSGEAFATGTNRPGVSGVYPRAKGALSAYSSRIRSYCDADDSVCQNGATGNGHSRYWQADNADAAAFALGKLASGPAQAPAPAPPAPAQPAPAQPAPAPATTPATPAPQSASPAPAAPAVTTPATPAPGASGPVRSSADLWTLIMNWLWPRG